MNTYKNDQIYYQFHNVTAKPIRAIVKVDKAVSLGYLVIKLALNNFLYKCLGFTPSNALPFTIFSIYLSREGCTSAIFDVPFPTHKIAMT